MNLVDILKSVAPTIATALGGPLAGAAVSFLAGKFGTENTLEAVEKAVQGFKAADIIKMKELDLAFQERMAEIGIKVDLAQIEVNKIEAASEHWFAACWRPAVGWVGAIGLAYAAILEPLARFVAKVGFDYNGVFPAIDTNLTLQILGAVLGVAGLRSWDKQSDKPSGLKGR